MDAVIDRTVARAIWLTNLPRMLLGHLGWLKNETGHLRRKFKSHASHVMKACGLLITISFASASLYYAKRSADYSRCQLDLARDEYCRLHPDFVSGETNCEAIFKKTTHTTVSDPATTGLDVLTALSSVIYDKGPSTRLSSYDITTTRTTRYDSGLGAPTSYDTTSNSTSVPAVTTTTVSILAGATTATASISSAETDSHDHHDHRHRHDRSHDHGHDYGDHRDHSHDKGHATMSCIIGERPGEWIYSLRGVYAQVNIGCQDPLYLLTGPWPYQRSIFLFRRTAPSLWDIRPALRRFLGAYMEGKGGVTGLGLRILPVLVLSGTAFLVCAVRGASNWRMRLMGALVFHATILSAHPALDPKTPWWSSWGHPYAGYGLQASAWLRPVLWQFPDAYLIASVFTNSGGVSACITLVGAALLCHYGLEGRTRRRSLQAACFLGLIVLPILVVLSWWLMKAELDNERQYWERRNTLEKNAQSRAVWVIGSHLGMM